MKIQIESILLESTATLAQKMGIEVAEIPPIEALRYFRLQEIPFLLFFLAKKTHRTTLKSIKEQYELQTGQCTSYDAARGLVSRFYDEVERVKMMDGKRN